MTPIRNVTDRERQLQAQINALRAEKSGPYFGHYQQALGKIAVLEGKATDLERERDALKADALRYRWFVKEMSTDSDALDACLVGLESNVDEGLNPSIEQFNSAIDEAMKEGAQ